MPIDLIVGYKFRPRPLKAEELAELRLALQHRSTELGEVGARLKQERQGWQAERATLGFLARRRRESDDRQAVMKFKQVRVRRGGRTGVLPLALSERSRF